MATYTDANGVKLITTGDEAGTWGSSTNVNLQILDRAANGFTSIALTGTTYTLTLSAQPSAAENGHFKAIKFTGTPGGTCTVTLGEANKARLYMILNSTNQSVIITQGSGSNVTIPTGKSSIVFADGAGSGAACTDFTSTLNGLSSLESPFTVGGTTVNTTGAELNFVDGVTSAIQTQLDGKQATITGAATTIDDTDLTGSRALISNASGKVAVSDVTSTELGYLDGVTSNIQTQLNSKEGAITLTADRAVVSDSSGIVTASDVTSTEIGYLDGVTSAIQTQLNAKQATITGAATTIDDADLTVSRALVSDSNGKVAVSDVTSTEIGYLDGVTSNIQTQLNSKEGAITLTANRAVVSDSSGIVTASDITSTELGYLDGVTSAIQTQLNGKQATITGAATTITGSDLTVSRALVSDGTGKVAVSAVTATELGVLDGLTATTTELNVLDGITATTTELNVLDGITATTTELNYVSGVTSAVQTQLNAKAPTASPTLTGTITAGNLNIANSTISYPTAGGDITIEAGVDGVTASDINLLHHQGYLSLSDGTEYGRVYRAGSNNFVLSAQANNADIVFSGSDGGSDVTALTLDMSEAGDALFNRNVDVPGTFTLSGGTQNWTVTASGTNLTFAYNGVNKMRLDSSGNLTVTGDVTAFGTIT
jgi:fructose-specific component phosphotransferase system IIB-like protein